jgi:hypothetical protein
LNVDGGIGNQLFALAYGLRIREQLQRNVMVILRDKDLIDKVKITLRKEQVNDDFQIISHKWVIWLLDLIVQVNSHLSKRFKTKYRAWVLNRRAVVIQNPWDIYDYEKLIAPKLLMVKGYFQNVNMINNLSEESKSILRGIISKVDKDYLLNKSKESLVIGAHLRRGDYEKIEEYGTISFDFFMKFWLEMEVQLGDAYVASDSEDLCDSIEEEFCLRVLRPSNYSPLETIEILCDSDLFVMSNSTFSFWIAWYVSLKGGRVIAPTPWFKSAEVPDDYLYLDTFEKKIAIFD